MRALDAAARFVRSRHRVQSHLDGLQLRAPLRQLCLDVVRGARGGLDAAVDQAVQALQLSVRPARNSQLPALQLELRRAVRASDGGAHTHSQQTAPVPAWCPSRTAPPPGAATGAARRGPSPWSAARPGGVNAAWACVRRRCTTACTRSTHPYAAAAVARPLPRGWRVRVLRQVAVGAVRRCNRRLGWRCDQHRCQDTGKRDGSRCAARTSARASGSASSDSWSTGIAPVSIATSSARAADVRRRATRP